MVRKPQKIEIATPEDVAKYAGADDKAPPADAAPPEAAPADGAAPQDALRAEVEQWKDKCLRARAELANYQRRSSQERTDAIKYANAEFARGMLNIVDDLERAVAHAGGVMDDGDTVVHALKLIHDNVIKVLRQQGVEPIDAVGQPFDPACHEALMQRESAEHAEPTVLEVFQKGYRLHERVLRPAKVVVSKPPEASEATEGQ